MVTYCLVTYCTILYCTSLRRSCGDGAHDTAPRAAPPCSPCEYRLLRAQSCCTAPVSSIQEKGSVILYSSVALYCTELYCIVSLYSTLYYTVSFCTVLYSIVEYTVKHSTLHCRIMSCLSCILLHCNVT
jgi:hypothetical protein